MTFIEIVAAVFGFLSVWFYIARNPNAWPCGLVQVMLLWVVFWNAKLYADFGLHVVFAGLQLYGWRAWRASQQAAVNPRSGPKIAFELPNALVDGSMNPIEVRSLNLFGHAMCGLMVATMTTAFSALLIGYTDAALPILDSFIAATSLVAQSLLAWRYVENWVYWIVVDVVGIGVFAYKELYPTAVLYVLFLGMAIFGFTVWVKASRIPSRTYEGST